MNPQSIIKVVMVIMLLGAASGSSTAEETWTRKADMPTARYGLSTSVVDGKIYAIGGGRAMYGAYLSTVEEYDPATDTWTRKADMPTARYGHAASVVNGKIYIIGGEPTEQASLPTVEEYDPVTDTWTKKTDMPTKRSFLCACTVDSRIYVFGGITAGVPGAVPNPPAMDVYDPVKDSWTTKDDIPTPRVMGSACVLDKRIYFMGGVKGDVHNSPLGTMEEYDPATDTWRRKADMPTPRDFLSASVVGGRIYAVGGGIVGDTFSVVEEYDPVTDTWTRRTDMSARRWMHASSAVNGKIYAIGGTTIWHPWAGISTVEEYDTGLTVSSPDFNGDGIVDSSDMCLMVDHWHTDSVLYDIAPPPFGDGIVDVQDLIVLAEHLFTCPGAVAHWRLDETEGDIAYDSAAANDAVVFGDALWQPDAGKVKGALQLNGIDDYVSIPFVLDPAVGAFSVFGWVKGSVPGQVIMSQTGSRGRSWLCTDSLDGGFMTGLITLGRGGGIPLVSRLVITDGAWHHIGLAWDGSYRYLYVDGAEAAKDTTAFSGLESADGGLYIGADKDLGVGSFFSGLIDEVRIYDRAVRP
jgi:N-acetylneuraminic acid mutarotase